jgi:signal transduction histidine kinase
LNIAYNIVTTLLMGTIQVECEAGRGTVFVLDLPLQAVAAPEALALPSARHGKARV